MSAPFRRLASMMNDAARSSGDMAVRVPGRARALWTYRGFVAGMVERDIRSRYLGSALGASWTLLNPLAQILIYTVVFSQVMQARLPGTQDALAYSVYLCSGVLTWSYFVEVLLRSQTIFLEQGNLLKKVSFPRITLPVYVFVSATVNFAIAWGLFLLFLLVTGRWPGWVVTAVIPLLMIQQAIALGLGVFFGVINVFFRDVGQAVAVALQFWFWLTPIVYPMSAVPEGVQRIIACNPLAAVSQGYQRIVVAHQWPVMENLWPAVVIAVGAAGLGDFAFRRLAGALVDEL